MIWLHTGVEQADEFATQDRWGQDREQDLIVIQQLILSITVNKHIVENEQPLNSENGRPLCAI